jgi:7-cyano-7-deazaguanine synthase
VTGGKTVSQPKAVVLLSGGADSATTLAIAREEGFALYALSFDYGQRHHAEVAAAARVAAALGVRRHETMRIDLRAFGGSALTADVDVPKGRSEEERGRAIPVTYVPARNTVFLAYALAWAETLDARDIFLGVTAVDYSGYPDCRPEFIEAFERVANLGTKLGVEQGGLRIHAPLIRLSKPEILARGMELGVDFGLTHSCYDPDEAGRACGTCDACSIRSDAFQALGLADPASSHLPA